MHVPFGFGAASRERVLSAPTTFVHILHELNSTRKNALNAAAGGAYLQNLSQGSQACMGQYTEFTATHACKA